MVSLAHCQGWVNESETSHSTEAAARLSKCADDIMSAVGRTDCTLAV